MEPERLILRLPPRPVADVLGELARLARQSLAGEPVEVPPVTLWLTSGVSLEGQLIGLEQGQVLLHRPALQAVYLPLEAIQAVTVHYTARSLHLLSQSRLDPLDSPVPSRLELKRSFQALLDDLGKRGEAAWDRFPADPPACQCLGLALAELREVLLEIGSDPEGREALGALPELRVAPDAAGPGVRREGSALVVELGLEAGQLRRLESADLKRRVEKIL